MNREQIVALLILDGFVPINDPYELPYRFHTAAKPGAVNCWYALSAIGNAKPDETGYSKSHSWTLDSAGDWDVIPDKALQGIYREYLRWEESSK